MPHKMIEHIEQSPNGDDYREKLVAAEHGLRGDTVGITRIITLILALCWSLFQLASASILLLDTVYIRAIHLAFAISLVYFNIPMIKISGTSWRWDLRILLAMNRVTILDYLLGIIAAVSALYIVLDYEGIASRAGVPTTRDIIFGLMLVVLLLEATRRVIGPALPIIASIFILYVFTGPHLPDFLAFKGASLSRFISQMTMDTEGIYGVPLHVSATVVFLFVLFGTMLERAGGGNFFIQLAISGLGRFRGGAAKAAVLGSALTGVVSGSSIANVVTTGTFTIPLMKKVGYPPEKAAAVEVASSINGQLAPPVMGAAAFIIAELTGTPYLDVALATVIPAILYFVSIFYMIDLEAYKEGLHGYAKDELPDARKVLLERGHLVIPIFVLIFVLIGLNASVIKAAIWAIYSTILCTFLRKSTRLTPEQFVAGFADGAKQAVGLIAACATAGIIIGVLNLTGTGLKFASGIIALSGGILPIALILTMGSSLILGMGLPTAAAYLICAAVIVPALTGLGVPALTGHLFIFYFACLSAITPPVALAAFTAASLGKTKPMGVALTAVRLGIVAFIVPFMFVYAPSLLWQGSLPEILGTLATSLCGVFFLGSALQGAFRDRVLNMGQRGLFLLGSLALIQPGLVTDLIGVGLVACALLWQWLGSRRG